MGTLKTIRHRLFALYVVLFLGLGLTACFGWKCTQNCSSFGAAAFICSPVLILICCWQTLISDTGPAVFLQVSHLSESLLKMRPCLTLK